MSYNVYRCVFIVKVSLETFVQYDPLDKEIEFSLKD